MTVSIKCTNCGATLHPTGRANRVRCSFCQADNLLDAATAAQLAQAVPIAPPEVMSRFDAIFRPHLANAELLVNELAHRLERALPGQVELEKHGGLFSKSKVAKFAAQIGDWRYEAAHEAAKLVAHRKHHVRGIVLKTVALNAAELVSALAGELHELTLQGPPADAALHRFFGG